MAKVNIRRDRHEEAETHSTSEENVHIMEPRPPASAKRDRPAAEVPPEGSSPPEIIDADWVEMGESGASTPAASVSVPEGNAEASAVPPRGTRENSSEFSFVNYVLLFFSAALLSALVMLAVLGQI